MDISKFKNFGGRFVGRSVLTIQKHSPEILTGSAVIGVVATAVLASRAVVKAKPVVTDIQTDIKIIRANEEISEKEINKDVAHRYLKGGLELAKIYGPTVTMGATTVICILGAHGIAKKRYIGMAAAYKGLETTFAEYRDRIAEEIGAEREEEIRTGLKTETVEDPETGKKKKVTTKLSSLGSQYARIFDETNKNWQGIPDYNDLFLTGQQNWANDMLKIRGHLTLNEVYDRLGFDRTPEGQLVGWVWGGDGDNFVDFGLHRFQYADKLGTTYDPGVIHLDFNVDGFILELIK